MERSSSERAVMLTWGLSINARDEACEVRKERLRGRRDFRVTGQRYWHPPDDRTERLVRELRHQFGRGAAVGAQGVLLARLRGLHVDFDGPGVTDVLVEGDGSVWYCRYGRVYRCPMNPMRGVI